MRARGVFVRILLLLTVAIPARATLSGSTLAWQYYAYGGAYFAGSPDHGTWTAPGNGGVFTAGGVTYFAILSDANSITFDYSTSGTWSDSQISLLPTIRNGIAVNLVSFGKVFSSVAIDASTNISNFSSSNVSFTAAQIQVDWTGLTFTPNTIVKLNIKTAVPEPSTGLLVVGGLLGLASASRVRVGCVALRRVPDP